MSDEIIKEQESEPHGGVDCQCKDCEDFNINFLK